MLLVRCTDKLDNIQNQQSPVSNYPELKSFELDRSKTMVHFKDLTEFTDFMEFIKSLDESTYMEWATNNKIPTHRYAYLTLLDELHKAQDEDQFFKLIYSNPDIVVLREEDGQTSVERTINSTFYSSIVNTKGEFAIGDIIYKFYGNLVVFGPYSQRTELPESNIADITSSLPQGFTAHKYSRKEHLKSNCGTNPYAVVIKDVAGCGDDRKLKCYYTLEYVWYVDHYVITYEFESKSSYKLFCIWTGGPSTHYHYNVSATIVSPCGYRNISAEDDSQSNTTYYTQPFLNWLCYVAP